MARSRSGIVRILLFAGLIVVALISYNRLRPRESESNPPTQRPPANDQAHRSEEGSLGRHPRHERPNGYREQPPASCETLGTSCVSLYFNSWKEPERGSCSTKISHGYPIPDSRCTPGGVNPSVSVAVLRNPDWRTRCVRNCQTSESEKHITYAWYRFQKPRPNSGESQVCELDHLVPLELGGADGLGNVWPECGPDATILQDRYFKVKDRVENYLADEVRAGRMPLSTAQHGIASDWTQYLPAANCYYQQRGRC